MKIEAGQWWRNREGVRVYIVGRKQHGSRWFVVESPYGSTYTVGVDGRGGNVELSIDLVEHLPWCTSFDCPEPVPKKLSYWTNFYDGKSSNRYVSKEQAVEHRGKGPAAAKTVQVRETYTDEELVKIELELSGATGLAKRMEILSKYFGGSDE